MLAETKVTSTSTVSAPGIGTVRQEKGSKLTLELEHTWQVIVLLNMP